MEPPPDRIKGGVSEKNQGPSTDYTLAKGWLNQIVVKSRKRSSSEGRYRRAPDPKLRTMTYMTASMPYRSVMRSRLPANVIAHRHSPRS